MGARKFVLHAFVMSAYFYSTWRRDSHGYPPPRWPTGKVEEAECAPGLPITGANVHLPLPQAWRRRWFVLRRGRLSGDRDVLEYYRSQRASKPIRTIDLSECVMKINHNPTAVGEIIDFVFRIHSYFLKISGYILESMCFWETRCPFNPQTSSQSGSYPLSMAS